MSDQTRLVHDFDQLLSSFLEGFISREMFALFCAILFSVVVDGRNDFSFFRAASSSTPPTSYPGTPKELSAILRGQCYKTNVGLPKPLPCESIITIFEKSLMYKPDASIVPSDFTAFFALPEVAASLHARNAFFWSGILSTGLDLYDVLDQGLPVMEISPLLEWWQNVFWCSSVQDGFNYTSCPAYHFSNSSGWRGGWPSFWAKASQEYARAASGSDRY